MSGTELLVVEERLLSRASESFANCSPIFRSRYRAWASSSSYSPYIVYAILFKRARPFLHAHIRTRRGELERKKAKFSIQRRFGDYFALPPTLSECDLAEVVFVLFRKISLILRHVSEWCFDNVRPSVFSAIVLIEINGDVQVHPAKKKFYSLAWQKARYALKTSVSFQPSFFR